MNKICYVIPLDNGTYIPAYSKPSLPSIKVKEVSNDEIVNVPLPLVYGRYGNVWLVKDND